MKFLSSILVAGLLALASAPAHAIPDAAQSCRVLLAAGTSSPCAIGAGAGVVTSSAWRTVISSAARALKGLYIYNSSPVFLKVAIGASGSESVQLIVPPGTLPGNAYNGSPVGSYSADQGFFYPIPISQGTKVAVEALDSDAAQGVLVVSEFFY